MARTTAANGGSGTRLSRGGPVSASSRAMTGSRSARIRAAAVYETRAVPMGELCHAAGLDRVRSRGQGDVLLLQELQNALGAADKYVAAGEDGQRRGPVDV